jgi:SAM-dependent methyltransferase
MRASPCPVRSLLGCILLVGATMAVAQAPAAQSPPAPNRTPDVVYVPTPEPVVDRMLEMAGVGADDVLYDLGSGDGRIPVTAAKNWGTRGVGVEIHAERVAMARRNAEEAGVADKVTIIHGDMFETDLAPATVISLYLLPSLNMKLRPQLQALKPGTRIVSHNYSMGDWQPDETAQVGASTVYLWTVK